MKANRTPNVQQLTMEINCGAQPPATMIKTRSGGTVQSKVSTKQTWIYYRARWQYIIQNPILWPFHL